MKKFIICAICAFCGLTTASAQKFGHVNTQDIVQIMPEFKAAQADLEKLASQYEADLKSMQDELQKRLMPLRKRLPRCLKILNNVVRRN